MSGPSAPVRDPTHELYDHACSLLAAAQAMRAGSRAPQPARDVDATLDCLAASLDAVAAALGDLGDRAADRLAAAERMRPDRPVRIRADEAEERFDELAQRLRRATWR